MLEVLAYPPPRRWWQFWRPSRPFLIERGIDYVLDESGDEATIFRPCRGWDYKIAYIR